jgi:hypothetical protein
MLERRSVENVQIIGGINTVALTHPETVIDFKAKEVIAPTNLDLPTVRDDKAGTLRDVDIFVKSSDPREIHNVSEFAEVTIGSELEKSIFGIVPGEALESQMRHPLGIAAFKTFLSDRYEVTGKLELPDGMIPSSGMVKSLFPFAVPLDEEALETWTLTVGRMHAPIPNPAMSVINYTTRSISGVRPKDAKKVENMAEAVLKKSPELRDWALDGPGAPQVELGLLLRGLTPKKAHVDYFDSGKPVLTPQEMTESELFMLPNIRTTEKLHIIGRAAHKAVVLNFFESNPTFVSIWQNGIERTRLIDNIVKNK